LHLCPEVWEVEKKSMSSLTSARDRSGRLKKISVLKGVLVIETLRGGLRDLKKEISTGGDGEGKGGRQGGEMTQTMYAHVNK
jgi:hypothetical protein